MTSLPSKNARTQSPTSRKFELPLTISTASIDSGEIVDGEGMLNTADAPLKERVRPPQEEVVAGGDFLLTFKNVAQLVQNDRCVLPFQGATHSPPAQAF